MTKNATTENALVLPLNVTILHDFCTYNYRHLVILLTLTYS